MILTSNFADRYLPSKREQPERSSSRISVAAPSSRSSQQQVAPLKSGPHVGMPRQCQVYDWYDSQISYKKAWHMQKQLVKQVQSQEESQTSNNDCVLLLQHPPTYTLGAGSTPQHLRFDLDKPPHPLYRTERGGEVTYHGPGQLVMYPILNLRHHHQDLHWYLRNLEEVVIRSLDSVSGLQGERIDGLTGVWVSGHKLAAVGIRVQRWVTYHGLALNVNNDLSPFSNIVPCGISDRPVGSVASMLRSQEERRKSYSSQEERRKGYSSQERKPTLGEVNSYHEEGIGGTAVHHHLEDGLLAEYRFALLEAFGEVFGLELVPADSREAAALVAGWEQHDSD